MTAPIPRRHHYVPQFYLHNFTTAKKEDKQPGFWIYDKAGGEPRRLTPLNTTVERDLYTFIKPDGTPDVTLEVDLFSRVEGWTQPILDRLIRRPNLMEGDFEMLTLFIALLHVRVPRMIRATQEHMEQFTLEWWKALGRDRGEVEKMWDKYCTGGEPPPCLFTENC